MGDFSIRINEADLSNVRNALSEILKAPDRVFVRALNKTLTGVKTDSSAKVRETLNASKKVVDETLKVQKASFGKMSAAIHSTGRPLPLIGFTGTRQTKKGVSVMIKKGRPRKVIPGTFIATMKTGHKGVFWRDKVGTKTVSRLPISERYSSRVPDILSNEPVMKDVLSKADERLHKNLMHELDYELSKLK
jgi:hypothetical protein